MTPNQIAVQIAEVLKRPLDSVLRAELIDKIKIWRSTLIRQTLQKYPAQAGAFMEKLIFELQPTTLDCGENCGYIVAETVLEVPSALRYTANIFNYIGSVDGKNAFTLVQSGYIEAFKHRRFSNILVEYTNDRIQVISGRPIDKLRIDMIPDDPEKTAIFKCLQDNTGNCDFEDQDLTCTNDIIQRIIELIPKVDFGVNVQMPPKYSDNEIQN